MHQLVLGGDLEGITRTMSVAGPGQEPYKDNTIMYADMTDAGSHYLQRLFCLGDRRFEDGTNTAKGTTMATVMERSTQAAGLGVGATTL